MKINCIHCGKQIAAKDVNIDRGIAKCTTCDSITNVFDQLEPSADHHERPRVAMPQRIKIEELGSDLVIKRSLFTPTVYALAIGVISTILTFFVASAFMTLASFVWQLFLLLNIVIMVPMTYYVFVLSFNSTLLRVHDGQLTVRHAPLLGLATTRFFVMT